MSNSAPTPPLWVLALQVVDVLNVVAPQAWTSVELRLERLPDASYRTRELLATPAEAKASPGDQLGLDVGEYFGLLGGVLGALVMATHSTGRSWAGQSLYVARNESEGRASVQLLDEGGTPIHSIDLDAVALAKRVYSDALLDELIREAGNIKTRQEAIAASFTGHDDWDFEQMKCELSLAKGILPWRKVRAVCVGTFATESATWLWAWANPDIAAPSSRDSWALREANVASKGPAAFRTPAFPCDEAFAAHIAALGALRMNARGIYSASFETGVIFLAVME